MEELGIPGWDSGVGGGTGGHLLGVFLVYERTRTRATYRQNRRFMVELR